MYNAAGLPSIHFATDEDGCLKRVYIDWLDADRIDTERRSIRERKIWALIFAGLFYIYYRIILRSYKFIFLID